MHGISQYYITDAARKVSQNHIQNTIQRLARAHPFAASRDYSILIFTILVPSGVRSWSRQTRIIFCWQRKCLFRHRLMLGG